ncbi:hypothetical protein [Streptomyces sp. NPDC046870]|uniref:hypothetical protein n=1 Tax=Streptomyces sp. NPDC046870 TaxID=3155135 RepID=UPI003451F9B8
MAYVSTAVTAGWLREPDSDIPLSGAAFADRITELIEAAANKPDTLIDCLRGHTDH